MELPNYEYENKNAFVIISLFSETLSREIKKKFEDHGFKNVVHYTSLGKWCGEEKFEPRKCNRCLIERGGCDGYKDKLRNGKRKFIDFPSISLVPTFRCTLHCKNCIQNAPKIKDPVHAEIDSYLEAIGRLLECFGFIDYVVISGGEFFIYKDWKSVIQYCLYSDKIGAVQILSNGIFSIPENDFSLLNNEKIVLIMDDYRQKISQNQREVFEKNLELLKRYDVNYALLDNNTGSWYDLGDFECRDYALDEMINIFSGCSSRNCYALCPDHSFAVCGRQVVGKYVCGIDEMDGAVNVMDLSAEKLREEITSWSERKYLSICNYCNGIGKQVPAGIQGD